MEFVKKYRYQILFFLIILGAFALRLYHIDFSDIWRDEAFSINIAGLSVQEIIHVTVKDTQPPLHILMLHFWIKFFGDSAFSVRFLSLIFGMVTLVYTYRLSLFYFRDRKKSTFALLLVAVSPLLIFYSQEARAYSMLTAFAVAALFYALQMGRASSPKHLLLFVLFSVLGLYTHHLFIVVLSSIVLFFIFRIILYERLGIIAFFKNRTIVKLILSGVLIVSLYSPWLFILISQIRRVNQGGFWLAFKPLRNVVEIAGCLYTSQKFFLSFENINRHFLITFVLLGCIIFLGNAFVSIGIFAEIKDAKKKNPVLTFFLISMLGSVFILSFVVPLFYVRYLVFVVPVLLVLVTFGVFESRRFLGGRISSLAAAVFVLACLFLSVGNISQNSSLKPKYSEAVKAISFNPQTDVIIHPRVDSFHSFNYYSDLPNFIYNPGKIYYFEGLAAVKDEDFLQKDLVAFERIWILKLSNWDYQEIERELLDRGFQKRPVVWAGGDLSVELWVSDSF